MAMENHHAFNGKTHYFYGSLSAPKVEGFMTCPTEQVLNARRHCDRIELIVALAALSFTTMDNVGHQKINNRLV